MGDMTIPTIQVNVSNKFESEAVVSVFQHHSIPCDIDDGLPQSVTAGVSSTFDLHNPDEYLEISLYTASVLNYPYRITAGIKAKAKCEFDGEPKEPENALFGAEYHEDGFYCGGIWKVEEKDKDKIWKLTIKEYKEYEFDLPTENVVIGPQLYTIQVNVSNKFESEAVVSVFQHHSIPCDIDDGLPQSVTAGASSTFDLHNPDEYLEISLDSGTPDKDYQIIVGKKAKCYANIELGPPQEGTYIKLLGAPEPPTGFIGPYGGGTWNVSKEITDWTLIINEYNVDPPTDDVVIGPPPP